MNASPTLPAPLTARHVVHTACPRCAASMPVTGPSLGARAGWYATWVFLALGLCGVAMTGLLVVVFGPLLFVLGIPVLAYLGTLCDARATCTRCGSYLADRAPGA